MLVVISDLHLTDGSCGPTSSPGAFDLIADRLADLAASASIRSDGSYRPIERIDLVLLGDALDVISSSRWLDFAARPWDDPLTPAVAEAVTTITGDILRRNDAALGVLRSLAQGIVRLTPANRMGRRSTTSDTTAVPVRIHYLVGNRDWFFHLPGQAYDRLRRQLVVHMGLASEPDAPFPHEPTESDELLQALRRHRVLARHGDAFDPLNYDGQRGASSIGDLIVIELLGRFVAEIERDLAPELPSAALAGLREIENVRPLLAAPQWLAGLLARTCPAPAVRLRVKQLWDVLADAVLDHPFLQNGQVCRPHNLVDGLARGLKFGRAATTGWGKETYRWLAEIRGVDSASYRQHALAEDDFRNRRARHIVYGHTHRAEEVPLESSHADGYVLNQMYFNAGTLRRVHAPTLSGPGEPDFVARDALSLVTFYHGDERRGRPYETWSGTLGVNPNELLTTPRVDAGANVRNATATPITPPVMLPIRAPHFDAAVQRDAFAARST